MNIQEYLYFKVIINSETSEHMGVVRLSPDLTEPDLAIWIYPEYRDKGVAKSAFKLALKDCMEVLNLKTVWAGCYSHNTASQKMLKAAGFSRVMSKDVIEVDVFDGMDVVQEIYVYQQ
jgi:RimJ/RimL family protein N-acetyltransferase